MSTHEQLHKLGLFDARVPRYTSYPTAPHFSSKIGATDVTNWIAQIPAHSEISLYLHIPFCRRLCWFCACRTQGTSTLSPVAGYIETLKAEIDLLVAQLPEGVTLSHLHWGGGTPTLLSPDLISDLAQSVLSRLPMAPNGQFSVEIDPSEVDMERLDALVAAGMNRASIGVQDFDPAIQAIIGREQSYSQTSNTANALRDRGIKSINMDMLYGLPQQTVQGISESVQKLLSMSPDRVALYGYAHVPWMAKRQALIPTDTLPTPQERLALFETARDLFVWDGYAEIGIDHFARPDDGLAIAAKNGTMRRNFQGYTEDNNGTLIALGASAISRYPQGFAQNNPSTSGYQASIRSGNFATAKGHCFEGEDLLRSRIIEELMCQFKADIPALGVETGTPPGKLLALGQQVAQEFQQFVDFRNGRLGIRPDGRPLSRVIARGFDAYDQSKARHSQAI
jgi:oxygen-independent coproporphyrinogen-3 oxidase